MAIQTLNLSTCSPTIIERERDACVLNQNHGVPCEREMAPLIRRRVDDVNSRPGLSPRQIISRRHNPVAARVVV